MNFYRAPPSNTAVMKEAMKLAKNKGKLITFSNLSNYNEKYDPKVLKAYSDGLQFKNTNMQLFNTTPLFNFTQV